MSEEIKPAAYMWQTGSGEFLGVSRNICTSVNIPLYTKQQLQPRVKMTQAEFDEFYELLSVGVSTIYDVFKLISEDRGETDEFENLYDRLFENSTSEQAVNQLEFARLWADFNLLHPEETIEIIQDKKWFVRSKETEESKQYGWLSIITKFKTPIYQYSEAQQEDFVKFDTKEEAEEWTNPLTEAVLLPVGDE